MRKQIYNEDQLPMSDFADIGLSRNGQIRLGSDDLNALLEGRRTDMMTLRDLKLNGVEISEVKAKLSIHRNANGELGLLIHPRYTNTPTSEDLTDEELATLVDGEVANLEKEVKSENGELKKILFEYDPETNELIKTDEDGIIAPDQVNSETLTPDQKARYRAGKEVELQDGTKFQFTGNQREGIRSNKLALVASIMVDGGLSFALYHGLKAMFGQKHDPKSKEFGKGYDQAVKEMKQQIAEGKTELKLNVSSQESRGYNRGSSR